MPALQRASIPFVCRGVNVAQPADRLDTGYFPRLINVRRNVFGELESRLGTATLNTPALADANVHSLRRLNNPIPGAAVPNQLFVGAGTNLYSGDPNPTLIDAGYSGSPLSMIPFRPEQSPESWLYIADALRMRKVNSSSVVKNIGVAPPNVEPAAELSMPLYTVVDEFDSAAGWTGTGTFGAVNCYDRIEFATTITSILYDVGNTGWCCVVPTLTAGAGFGGSTWLQAWARYVLSATETVTAQEVHNPLTATTVAAILYDTGATGKCSIVLASAPTDLARNSVLRLNSAEYVRVTSVQIDVDGHQSFRCSTVGTIAAGQAAVGVVSFRAYTTLTHANGDAVTAKYINSTITKGTAIVTKTVTLDLSRVGGRQIQADDLMHISLGLSDNPTTLTEGQILIDVDQATNDFTQNYYYKPFSSNDYIANAVSSLTAQQTNQAAALALTYNTGPLTTIQLKNSTGWCELVFRIGDLVRVGSDLNQTLANVKAIRIQWTVTQTDTVWVDSWWIGGGYGPEVTPGSIDGVKYRYRYRDSTTGAKSMPSPPTKYPLYPLRQSVALSFTASSDPAIDVIDVERLDPNLQSPDATEPQWTYLTTVLNATPVYTDTSRADILANNPALETNVWQPWPVLSTPIAGLCTVCGSSVLLTTGTVPLNLAPGTQVQITIPGNQSMTYQLYQYPVSTTQLTLASNAGYGAGATFKISSPLLTGTPLPIMFGPLEGPTSSYMFGLGDPLNPGTLYWLNGNDPDSASDSNSLEITPPSEPLIGGIVWSTLVYVFSKKRVFIVRRSFDFLTSLQNRAASASTVNLFTFYQIPSASGLWAPWALCASQDGVDFLGHDGLYRVAAENVTTITDETLYPLFPHEGVEVPTLSTYSVVDMTQTTGLRLNFVAGETRFQYQDLLGGHWSFRYDAAVKGWFPYQYANPVVTQYWEEVPAGVTPRLLSTTNAGTIVYDTTTLTDDAALIVCTVRTPSDNGKDSRAQKLYMDAATDLTGTAVVTVGFDFHTTTLAPQTVSSAARGLDQSDIATLLPNLALHINIDAEFVFNGGTQIYEYQPTYYLQPYLSTSLVLRTNQAFPDWQHARDSLWPLISTAAVLVTLDVDGVSSSFTLPSTAGSLRKLYQRMPAACKGREWIWTLTSLTPFAFFADECVVRLKSWTGDLIDVKPFVPLSPLPYGDRK